MKPVLIDASAEVEALRRAAALPGFHSQQIECIKTSFRVMRRRLVGARVALPHTLQKVDSGGLTWDQLLLLLLELTKNQQNGSAEACSTSRSGEVRGQ